MENNICKCGAPLKLHTLFAHIVRYCDACWGFFESQKKVCNHENFTLVKHLVGNGKYQVREQCNECGDYRNLPCVKQSQIDLSNLVCGNDRHDLFHAKFNESCNLAYKVLRQRYSEKAKVVFFEKYRIYLKSEMWQNKRRIVFKRDSYICQSCLVNPAKQVHHLSYTHVFSEPAFDLISVCDDCHKQIHDENGLLWAVGNALKVSVKDALLQKLKN